MLSNAFFFSLLKHVGEELDERNTALDVLDEMMTHEWGVGRAMTTTSYEDERRDIEGATFIS
jgi:hypothetical protein